MSGGLTKYASTDYINLSKLIKDEMVVIIYSKQEIEDYNKNLNEKKEIIKYQIIEKECVCPNTINDACISENNELSSNENDFKEEIENNNSNEKNNNDNKLLNINEATLEELQTINGVGESKAKAIIEYRKENKFEKIEDIKNVSGVGDSLFEKIKDYITV
ncbi:MAG: helix-hairpin-helix domain-containing protein [Bacilli bacterium]|nr:helix-hairpin-helix domain-containing protein [Bacilli bacterium]